MEKLIIPSLLSINDVIYLSTKLLEVTQPLIKSDARLRKLYTIMSVLNDRLIKNQKYNRKSLLTEKRAEQDKLRDRAFKALRDLLHGYSISLIEEMAAPASELYAIVDKYGTNTYTLSYKIETTVLNSLLTEFDLEKNQQLLNTLGILPIYNSLKTAQQTFVLISKQRTEEKTVQSNENEAAGDIVLEMIPALTNLVAYMQLYSQLLAATHGEVYKEMVTLITEINTGARSRKTRKDTEPEENAV